MNADRTFIPLHRIAHGRAGDKGNTLNLSVIAYRPEMFPIIEEQLTEDRVRQLFRHRTPTSVKRYVLPKLGALNFVLEGALDGGVNETLNLDAHGKTLSYLLLGMEILAPAELAASLAAGSKAHHL